MTVDDANMEPAAKRGNPRVIWRVSRSISPGPAGLELDPGNLLTIISESESLFERKRHSY
jgi:hypothetical protein